MLVHFRIRIVKEGRKRKLIINDAKVTDGGVFACTSNADKTEAELIIKCESIFYERIQIIYNRYLIHDNFLFEIKLINRQTI